MVSHLPHCPESSWTLWYMLVPLMRVTWCSLHSPIDSRWTPHIPHELHGVQVESRWSPTHIAYFGVHSMESRWTPWNPSGIHLDSIDSRWTPGGIQLEFVKMKNRHLFINLKWILRLKKIDISYI